MTRALRTLALGLAISVGLVACSGSSTSTASPSGSPAATTGSLVVDNQSPYTIWYLYVSDSDDDSWGPDQLGARTIPAYSSFTLNNIPCNQSYDLRVDDSAHDSMAEEYGVFVGCGRTSTWTLY